MGDDLSENIENARAKGFETVHDQMDFANNRSNDYIAKLHAFVDRFKSEAKAKTKKTITAKI